ncbi:MAG: hypothetical protein LBJ64_03545 [Deltaproteobacteria bacterium]|jgi:hypothetical protein|nr:hypothetical protein [Deltaproteobacteria bacterium]
MTIGAWEWSHAILGGVASLVFVFQTLSSGDFDGGSADFDFDVDVGGGADGAEGFGSDADGHSIGMALSEYLSVRNLVAFLIGYGWVTFAGLCAGWSKVAASLAGTGAGIALVFASLLLLRTFLKFQEDGSLNLKTLEGRDASVYIAIHGSAANIGKVMVDTKSGRMELPARTRDEEAIRPGKLVKILSVVDGVLWVTTKE